MTKPRAADDFTEIRKRMEELRRTEGLPQQHPGFEKIDMINVAGPAGNPTQPGAINRIGAPTLSPTGEPKTPKHAEPFDEDE